MEALAFLLFLVILAGILIPALPFWHMWVYYRARTKGYKPPAASLITLAGWFPGIAAATIWEVHRFSRGQQAAVDLLEVLGIILAIAGLLTAILLRSLPQRNPRVSGRRQIRVGWSRLSLFAAAACLAPLVIAVFFCAAGKLEFGLLLAAVAPSVGCSVLFAYYARMLNRYEKNIESGISLEEYLLEDARPPVLYLRPFKRDYYTFVGDEARTSFEGYFSDALRKLGPFVALGNPEDYLPRLTGAVRLYASDQDWVQKLGELARRSCSIIAEMSRSTNLRLEYEYLRSEQMQERLFVFTPPPEWEYRRWIIRWAEWARFGTMDVRWQDFSKELAKLGYHLDFGDPGFGSVITFDAEGRGIVLTTRAGSADEFVKPIDAWLARQERIGRCIPTHCLSCGRVFHVFPADAGAIRERWCANCEGGLTGFDRAVKKFCKRHQTLVAWIVSPLVLIAVALPARLVSQNDYVLMAVILPVLLVELCLFGLVYAWFTTRVSKRIVRQYCRLAEVGDGVAMANLGIINRGRGILSRNDALAAEWFRKAAEAGDIVGMLELGEMLENGLGGLQKDDAEAARWYRRAAGLGSRAAQLRLERLQISE